MVLFLYTQSKRWEGAREGERERAFVLAVLEYCQWCQYTPSSV